MRHRYRWRFLASVLVLAAGHTRTSIEPLRTALTLSRRRYVVTAVLAAAIATITTGWVVLASGIFTPSMIETTVRVESYPPQPGLAIWVNDAPVGLRTPAEVPLLGEEGQSVRLDLVRPGEVVASTGLILAPETSSEWVPAVDVLLGPIRYRVTSAPTGARVTLNGQTLARATPVNLDLLPGQTYNIEVELNGYQPLSRTLDPVDITAGTPTLLFYLTRIVRPGVLRAVTEFPVTMIARSEDGNTYQAEGQNPSLAMPPGRYSVSIAAPEVFFSTSVDVTVSEGVEVSLSEVPPAVSVRILDTPGSAMVRFGDYPPFPTGGRRAIAVGSYDVVFKWPGGERIARTVQIERDDQEVSARRPNDQYAGAARER